MEMFTFLDMKGIHRKVISFEWVIKFLKYTNSFSLNYKLSCQSLCSDISTLANYISRKKWVSRDSILLLSLLNIGKKILPKIVCVCVCYQKFNMFNSIKK